MTSPPRAANPRGLPVRLVCLIHRCALRLAPKQIRDAHRGEMLDTFAVAADAAARRGRVALLRLAAHEVGDLALARRLFQPGPSSQEKKPGVMTMLVPHMMRPTHVIQAMRSLKRRPAFAAATLVTLTLGTAATTTLFGLVDTVLLRPLPYPQSAALITVQEADSSRQGRASLIAPVRLEDWNRLNQTLTAIAGSYTENVTDTSGADPERLDARRVTKRFFQVYGVDALAGRTFTPDEERAGGPLAAVVSEALWTRRFNRSVAALGARLIIGGQSVAIVGVMPRSFTAAGTDLWLPAQFGPGAGTVRQARFLTGLARMKPGVTVAQAGADLARVQYALGQQFPDSDKNWSVIVRGLKGARIDAEAPTLWLAFGAVGLLWLIGVANMAGLMLVQMHRRSREFAIRTAIGAARAELISVVACESLVVALASAAAGTALAVLALGIVRTTITTLPRLNELEPSWHLPVFALLSGLAAMMIYGVWPALSATRTRLAVTLHVAARGSTSARHGLQRVLVVAQVALSVTLVASATLVARTYVNLSQVNLGFNSNQVLTFHVGARWDEDRNRIGQLQQRLIEGLMQSPDVEAAGFTNFLPTSNGTQRYQVKIAALAGPEQDGSMSVGTRTIGGSYLQTLQIPLVAGSWCPALQPDFDAKPSVLVNRRFVDEFAKGQNIVGRDLAFTYNPKRAYAVAGVIGDVVEDSAAVGPMPFVYACEPAGTWPDPEYVVRMHDVRTSAAAIRGLMRTLDPTRAVFGMMPLGEVAASSLAAPRMNAGLLGLFALAAMALAAIGLSSLFMQLVGERTREIGVRMALGAAPGQMTKLVLTGAWKLLSIGIAAGLLMNLATATVVKSMLFGVTTGDPLMLLMAVGALAVVATLAVAIPASRAARVDPIVAMRID